MAGRPRATAVRHAWLVRCNTSKQRQSLGSFFLHRAISLAAFIHFLIFRLFFGVSCNGSPLLSLILRRPTLFSFLHVNTSIVTTTTTH